VKAATLHRSDFVQQNAANTKTNAKVQENHRLGPKMYFGLTLILNERVLAISSVRVKVVLAEATLWVEANTLKLVISLFASRLSERYRSGGYPCREHQAVDPDESDVGGGRFGLAL